MKDIIAECKSLIRRRKYKKAKDKLIAYSSVNRNAEALALLAYTSIFLKDYTAAEDQVHRALRVNSLCIEAMLAKAYISLHNGHRENALREYFTIIDIAPNNMIAKQNVERIRFLTNNVREKEINPRHYLIEKRLYIPSKSFITVASTVVGVIILYFAINYFYPIVRYRILNKEQRELRAKLSEVYLFEGLENGKIPDSAKSPTYSPKQVANMFEKAKENMRSANVNDAVMIINGALRSDINEYLKERFRVLKSFIIAPDYNIFRISPEYITVVSDAYLYNGGYVKWDAEVSSVSLTNIDGTNKNKARILVYNNDKNKIVGIADLIVNEDVMLTPKSLIEVYGKIDGYDEKEKALQITAQLVKHLPQR